MSAAQNLGPARVALGNIPRNIPRPTPPHRFVVIQVKLSIVDGPGIPVTMRRIALRDRIGTVSAELRRVFVGIGLEGGLVLGTGKAPLGPVPFGHEIVRSAQAVLPGL